MEKAFHALGARASGGPEHLHDAHGRSCTRYGLRPDLLAMTQVWQTAEDGRTFVVAAKGAPEAIAELCRLDAADRAALTQPVDAMAADGLRVLGVARADVRRATPGPSRSTTSRSSSSAWSASPIRCARACPPPCANAAPPASAS